MHMREVTSEPPCRWRRTKRKLPLRPQYIRSSYSPAGGALLARLEMRIILGVVLTYVTKPASRRSRRNGENYRLRGLVTRQVTCKLAQEARRVPMLESLHHSKVTTTIIHISHNQDIPLCQTVDY